MVNYIYLKEKRQNNWSTTTSDRAKLVPGVTVLQAGCNISSIESNLAYWIAIVIFLPQNHSVNLLQVLSFNMSTQPCDYPSQPMINIRYNPHGVLSLNFPLLDSVMLQGGICSSWKLFTKCRSNAGSKCANHLIQHVCILNFNHLFMHLFS